MRRRLSHALILICAAFVWAQTVRAQDAARENVLIEADEVTYDENANVVIATGDVELIEGDRILRAREVRYDQNTGVAVARGDVVVVEPNGEVLFADYVELEEELTRGFVDGAKLLLEDDSRFAAADAARSDGSRTVMRRAVYSPCDVCAEEPEEPPLWQLKAKRIVHDQDKEDVIYYHAFLEFFGIPVFYAPYFTHPDPSVERRSGFLAPDFGFDDQDGFRFSTPYYWSITPDFDVTFKPIFLAASGAILNGELRKRWSFGEAVIEGGGGWLPNDRQRDDNREMRGHVFAKGVAVIDENWRVRGEAKRVSDDTYLRRYDISNDSQLDSFATAERFGDRSYAAVTARAFQGLRQSDVQRAAPLVLPEFEAETYLPLGASAPGRMRLAARGFAIERDSGADSARASVSADWRAPFLLPMGQEATISAEVRADGFLVGNSELRSDEELSTDARFHPSLGVEWRWPFARFGETTTTFVEPVANVVIAPYDGKNSTVPNEDSIGLSLDRSLLFARDRYAGIDRVETGPRATYGLRAGYIGELGEAEFSIGQSHRFNPDSSFADGSGLSGAQSDIVGGLRFAPTRFLSAEYDFRLDNGNFNALEHRARINIGAPELALSAAYDFVDGDSETIGFDDREQLDLNLSSQFLDHYRLSAGWLREIEEGFNLRYTVGLSYFDECFELFLQYERRNFRDREIAPENAFFLRVNLQNLGEISSSF